MNYQPVKPSFLGRKILDSIDLNSIVKYIDWTFFFHTWKIMGKYPGMETLCDCVSCQTAWLLQFPEKEREKAQEAFNLFRDAQTMLKEIISNKKLHAKAILYFSEAKSENDGILFLPNKMQEKPLYIPTLRQQKPNETAGFCYSLSDFISPLKDFIGIFAVTIQGAEEMSTQFQSQDDDYNALLIKSLADRLAEAVSEWLHEQVRKYYWGYATQENFTTEELRKVPYQGIRPAIGYPSMPDQSIIFDLDELLHLDQIGITLTENGVMLPNSSICGLYFAHPAAFYFMVGKIGEDQLKDYAKRKKCDPEKLKKWLAKIYL
jgi:5-methyltetrahydrofolate--homocysteine methyltransferase